jgi:hypothetical protein
MKPRIKVLTWGGCPGCFQHPDGQVWGITWNPAWEIKE